MDKTPLEIADAALHAVYDADNQADGPTGVPAYDGTAMSSATGIVSLAGRIPARVTWTTDRGNWTWDGVLTALTAMGIDVERPL